MSALAQCDAFAFIYDQAGDPAPDVLVVLKRVLDAGGNPILLGPKTTLTDSAGAFHFTLPELATAFISARASALWNCPEGRAFTVPPGPSGELVPDFSLPASTLVEPPLVYVGDVLSIPKASETQDGYLSAADYVAFLAGGAEVGVTQIDTGAGLTGGPITETGTIAMLPISGVAGTWANPTSISINAYGQIIAISATADTTAPVISAISATSITGSGATILWTTDDFSDSQVEYSTDTSYSNSTTLNTTSVTSHSVPLTGLIASQGYHYRVKSRNTATLLTTSGDNTFTTGAVVDTTPPVISAITATAITDTGATITWTTDDFSDSRVEYGLTTSYGSSTTIDPTMVTSHSAPITGTIPSTLYHYRVKSLNAASLLATSADNTFTTAAGPPVDLLTDLYSYWKLDEAIDYRFDATASANTLTPNLAFTTATGKFNICPHWDGTGKFMHAADGSVASMGVGVDYTIAAWVQIEDKTVDRDFITKGGDSGILDEYMIGYQHSATSGAGRFRFTIETPSFNYYTVLGDDIGEPAIGTWYLVVVWHNVSSSTLNVQVNNGPVNSFALVQPPSTSTVQFRVGNYGAAVANFWFGLVDEVAIWRGRLLDTDTRTGLWNGGSAVPFDSWT